MKKIGVYLLHLLQVLSLSAIYVFHDLYANHLGFMRNVSFYQAEVFQSPWSKLILPLALVLAASALVVVIRRPEVESGLYLLLTIGFVSWQLFFSLATQPIYYLISVCLGLVCLFQSIIVVLRRKEPRG